MPLAAGHCALIGLSLAVGGVVLPRSLLAADGPGFPAADFVGPIGLKVVLDRAGASAAAPNP